MRTWYVSAQHQVTEHLPKDIEIDQSISWKSGPTVPTSLSSRRHVASSSRQGTHSWQQSRTGCGGARDQLLALGEKLKSPMVHTLRGKEHVAWDNPYDVGMTGLIGFSSGYHAMNDCDALLMLGTDFPYRQFYPPGFLRLVPKSRKPGNGRHTRHPHHGSGRCRTRPARGPRA
jgi:hypothetical protein